MPEYFTEEGERTEEDEGEEEGIKGEGECGTEKGDEKEKENRKVGGTDK